MNTIEAIKGKEQMIIDHYNLPPITYKRHFSGACPLCGKKHKFRLDFYNGSLGYICVCGNGSLLSLICEVTGRLFKDIAAEVDRIIGNTFKAEFKQPIDDDFKQRFLQYPNIRGSQAQQYLNSRGIYSLPKRGIKYCEGVNDAQGYLSAMIAVASDEYSRPCYEHRTFLANGDKAQVQTQKRMMTINKSDCVSVKLFDSGSVLGVSEGIETALSAHELYKMPVWASLNSAFLKKFKAPKSVEKLYIFADNDRNGTGHAAAFECGNKNLLSKNDVKEVVIRWPSKEGDFNDVLTTDIEVVEWTLSK